MREALAEALLFSPTCHTVQWLLGSVSLSAKQADESGCLKPSGACVRAAQAQVTGQQACQLWWWWSVIGAKRTHGSPTLSQSQVGSARSWPPVTGESRFAFCIPIPDCQADGDLPSFRAWEERAGQAPVTVSEFCVCSPQCYVPKGRTWHLGEAEEGPKHRASCWELEEVAMSQWALGQPKRKQGQGTAFVVPWLQWPQAVL